MHSFLLTIQQHRDDEFLSQKHKPVTGEKKSIKNSDSLVKSNEVKKNQNIYIYILYIL